MTEQKLSVKFQRYFCRWFDIKTEQWDSTGNSRIDLIMTNKKLIRYSFGIELKKDGKKRGNDYNHLIKQAGNYAKLTFNGVRLPIFIAPSISNDFIQIDKKLEPINKNYKTYFPARHNRLHQHHNLNGILAAFMIGEVRRIEDYHGELRYAFIFNNKIIWDSIRDVHEINYNFLMNK